MSNITWSINAEASFIEKDQIAAIDETVRLVAAQLQCTMAMFATQSPHMPKPRVDANGMDWFDGEHVIDLFAHDKEAQRKLLPMLKAMMAAIEAPEAIDPELLAAMAAMNEAEKTK